MQQRKPSTTSKYLREYGLRLTEMAEILGMSIGSVHAHLNDDEKRPFLLRHLISAQKIPPAEHTYPNHHILKRQRLVKLERVHGQCQLCGDHAEITHHIDGCKGNHNLDNLLALCTKCHGAIETGRQNQRGPYLRKYGLRQKDIVKLLGISSGKVSFLHKYDKLVKRLET